MAALTDALAQNKGLLDAPASGLTTGDLATRAQQVTTGQAAPTGRGPKLSNLAERAANIQTEADSQVLAGQAGIADLATAQRNEAQQKQYDNALREASDSRNNMLSEFNQNMQNVIDAHQQGIRTLDLQKASARTEQFGVMMRMSNEQYITNLKQQGAKARLQDKYKMQEELTRAVFDDEIDLLQNDLDFRAAIAADDRKFMNMMQDLDIDQAIKLAGMQQDSDSASTIASGIGTLGSAAAEGYYTAKAKKKEG